MENNYTQGKNQYLKTATYGYNILTNWKTQKHLLKIMMAMAEGVVFLTTGGGINEGYTIIVYYSKKGQG